MLNPERHKEKTASNRRTSAEVLERRGVPFVSKNDGAHLIINNQIDFWPGTGLWIVRQSGKKGRGVFNLLAYLNKEKP